MSRRRRDYRKHVSYDQFALDAFRGLGNAKSAFDEYQRMLANNERPRFYQDFWGDYQIELPPDYSGRRLLKGR